MNRIRTDIRIKATGEDSFHHGIAVVKTTAGHSVPDCRPTYKNVQITHTAGYKTIDKSMDDPVLVNRK